MNTRVRIASLIACSLLAPAVSSLGAPDLFTNDLAAAKAKAKQEHKDVFVDFTGSDWCGWCLVLEKKIFNTAEFQAKAPELFELVQLDFPNDKTKQSAEVTARNKEWRRELQSTSFPDMLILDENGKVYARTNYREGGPVVFLKHLEDLRQRRIQRDAALAQAEKAEGLEKAKQLDAALSALRNDEVILKYYSDSIKQIRTLDPQDQGGLKTKYAALYARAQCEREIDRLSVGVDGPAALAKFKEYGARTDIPVESRQYALYMAGALACERLLKDAPQGLELVNQAIALAPDSQIVEDRIKEAKLRLERKIATDMAKPTKAK